MGGCTSDTLSCVSEPENWMLVELWDLCSNALRHICDHRELIGFGKVNEMASDCRKQQARVRRSLMSWQFAQVRRGVNVG